MAFTRACFSHQTGSQSLVNHIANGFRLFFRFWSHHGLGQEVPSARRLSAVFLLGFSSRAETRSRFTSCAGSSVAMALQISISAGFRPCLFANSAWKRSETLR